MSTHRSRKQERCAHEDCGSRRFHEGEDGYTYCDQGHQQSDRGAAIATDTGELVVLGKTSRRKVDSDAESGTSKASSFKGSTAFSHYLLCIQLVLRKQLHWLTTTQKLPDELESLVKDLWALRLQKVQSRVTYDSETETEAPSSQFFSSQSESEATSASRSTRRKGKKKEQVQEGSPKLVETLTLCYIGILLIRLPVTVADFHRWINAGELLYYRTIREIPLGMRERLPPRYQAQLEPQDLLAPANLHEKAFELLKTFNTEFGMTPPPLNVPLVLYRWLQSLVLPIEVYAGSQRLARLLDMDFTWHVGAKAGTNLNLRFPEARLMALVVLTTKVLFPFDSVPRHTTSPTSLSAITFDWPVWLKTVTKATTAAMQASPRLSFEEAFSLNESSALAASDDKLDSYLDWYQDNVATEEIRERGRAGKDAGFRRAMFGLFPLQETKYRQKGESGVGDEDAIGVGRQEGQEKSLKMVMSKLRPRLVLGDLETGEDAETQPVGSGYRRYRSVDELEGVVKTFYERAAELAGLGLEDMVQIVFLTERKMQKVEEKLRKEAID